MRWPWDRHFIRLEMQGEVLIGLLGDLLRQGDRIMSDLTDILANEQSLDTAVGQLITLTDQIKALLDNSVTDPATVAAIKAAIDTTKQSVADTLTRDTPATPTPTTTP